VSTVAGAELLALDFDIENRPATYWYEGQTTAQITAIAWAFVDKPSRVECALLTPDLDSYADMLIRFVPAYEQAEVVTGHYIRGHDLPIINAALVELGMAPLKEKFTQDTKLDLINWKDIPKSQEHLCEMLGVPKPKVQMSQHKWRIANRLEAKGIALTEVRAVGDVKQHMALRKELLRLGLLGPPKMWRP